MLRSTALTALLLATTMLVTPAVATSANPPTLLRLDGVGPLKLGMTQAAAVKTGWLAGKGKGCELGSPVPVTYTLTGASAPDGIAGVAQFTGGRLANVSFRKGVRTAKGVKVGSSVAAMVKAYGSGGYKVKSQYIETFQGTFVNVTKKGKQVLGAFAEGKKISSLGLPEILTCD